MRASWMPDLSVQPEYMIAGDRLHHLINVVRVSVGDELLLLNGKGLKVVTEIKSISKKELRLSTLTHEQINPSSQIDLALGVPKKDALDLVLKQATELGFFKIYLVRSEYSQTRIPDDERILNVLVSALEQSNAAFLPTIVPCGWEEIPWTEYGHGLMLDSQSKKCQNNDFVKSSRSLLVVGPEGGFSPQEISFLHQVPQMEIVFLPTPILRTPTAVSTGAGILLGRLLD